KRAADVDGHDRLELLVGGLGQWTPQGDASVRHHEVGGAKAPFDLVEQPADVVGLSDIGVQRDTNTACGFYRAGGLACLVFVAEVARGDNGPGSGEAHSDGPPDAARGPGDDGHFPCSLGHGSKPFCWVAVVRAASGRIVQPYGGLGKNAAAGGAPDADAGCQVPRSSTEAWAEPVLDDPSVPA